MPLDLPPQAMPAHEVQMVREVGGENRPVLSPIIFLAQLSAPSVAMPRDGSNNWTKGDLSMARDYKDWAVRGRDALKATEVYDYKPNGPLGMPALTLEVPTDYSIYQGRVVPTLVDLAKSACLFLDVEAQQLGAWGPECRVLKFVKMPTGKLVKSDDPRWPGAFRYTPPKIGRDTVRFILENGAGKTVDVTIRLRAQKYR